MKPALTLLTLALIAFALAFLTGCASYVHERPIFAVNNAAIVGFERSTITKQTPAGKGVTLESTTTESPIFGSAATIVGYERTRLRTQFMMGRAGKISSVTKDGHGYSRALSVGGVQMQGDAEAMKATGETIGVATGAATAEIVKRFFKP